MATGGSIQEVTLKNRRFAVAADAESQIALGGFNTEIQPNGDGSVRAVKTRVPFKIDGVQLSIDTNAGDAEFLQELCDSNDLFPITITLVSGNTYQGVGTITGEVQFSTQNSTCTVSLQGQAKLTIQ